MKLSFSGFIEEGSNYELVCQSIGHVGHHGEESYTRHFKKRFIESESFIAYMKVFFTPLEM